jgi:hypothetical protein
MVQKYFSDPCYAPRRLKPTIMEKKIPCWFTNPSMRKSKIKIKIKIKDIFVTKTISNNQLNYGEFVSFI